MTTGRLQAFSDGVIAILITIMVLELRTPDGGHWDDLRKDVPVLLAYVLSFVLVGIYWTNHHHMLAVVHTVTGAALWANLHLLFWLSLVPFTTDWMSENDFASAPVAAYGIDLLACAVAYFILQHVLQRADGEDSVLHRAVGTDAKGKASALVYVVGIALSFVDRWFGVVAYVVVALLWFIPDRRVERALATGAPPLTD
ncbi:TMEM175 family protein [uncultured Jatrophihabitans sp.]|uniref:TMEM175 family protein n=1 Tax=uncultured Jatrophihabitans sp. TaxID=1610747 RepID=UPI0035CC71D3